MVFTYEPQDKKYARTIMNAFNPVRIVTGANRNMSPSYLCESIRYAKIRCGKDELVYCIEWAKRKLKES